MCKILRTLKVCFDRAGAHGLHVGLTRKLAFWTCFHPSCCFLFCLFRYRFCDEFYLHFEGLSGHFWLPSAHFVRLFGFSWAPGLPKFLQSHKKHLLNEVLDLPGRPETPKECPNRPGTSKMYPRRSKREPKIGKIQRIQYPGSAAQAARPLNKKTMIH